MNLQHSAIKILTSAGCVKVVAMLLWISGLRAILWRGRNAIRMRAALQLVGWDTPSWPYRVAFAWCWEEWGWGLCTDLAELGFAALVIGPLHIQFDWDIA